MTKIHATQIAAAPNTQSGAAYTLVFADIGRPLLLSNEAPVVTIPTGSFPLPGITQICNIGTGTATLEAGAGVTLNGAALTIPSESFGWLIQTAANVWQFVAMGGGSEPEPSNEFGSDYLYSAVTGGTGNLYRVAMADFSEEVAPGALGSAVNVQFLNVSDAGQVLIGRGSGNEGQVYDPADGSSLWTHNSTTTATGIDGYAAENAVYIGDGGYGPRIRKKDQDTGANITAGEPSGMPGTGRDFRIARDVGRLVVALPMSPWIKVFDLSDGSDTGFPAVSGGSDLDTCDVSDDGSVIAAIRAGNNATNNLFVFDAAGTRLNPNLPGIGGLDAVAVSPDGTKVAAASASQDTDIYIYDVAADTLTAYPHGMESVFVTEKGLSWSGSSRYLAVKAQTGFTPGTGKTLTILDADDGFAEVHSSTTLDGARIAFDRSAAPTPPGPANWTLPDISTSAARSTYSTTAVAASPYDLQFNADGTKMYVLDDSTASLFQYTLGTAFDETTASYDSKSVNFSSEETAVRSVAFGNDGAHLYLIGNGTTIFRYTLSTAWDISTAAYDGAGKTLDASGAGGTDGHCVRLTPDGTRLFVLFGDSTDTVFAYDLGTAWDISTGTLAADSFSTASQNLNPTSLRFNPDGSQLFIHGLSYPTALYQYDVGTAWDLSTVTYSGNRLRVDGGGGVPAGQGLAFSADGSVLYFASSTDDLIHSFTTGATP